MQENIIFIHGNSGSPQDWQGVVSELGPVISPYFINLSGNFDNLADSYSLKSICEDSIKQIKSFNLESYKIVAHSLGGHIAFQLAPKIMNECSAIFTFGAPPLSYNPIGNGLSPFLPNENSELFSSEYPSEDLLKAVYFENFSGESISYDAFSATFSSTDGRSRVQLFASVMAGQFDDEVENLRSFQKPVYFCHCSQDPIINQDYISEATKLIANAEYFTNDKLDCQKHYPHIEDQMLIAELIQNNLLAEDLSSLPLKANDETNTHA